MKKEKKKIREKGKVKFSRMFQVLKSGDKVAVVRDISFKSNIPRRYQGKTGIVEGVRGRCYIIKIMDMNQEKTFILDPIHLKKIK